MNAMNCRIRHPYRHPAAVAVLAAALLAACGGGDGVAPAFDAGSYVAVAAPVTETVQASISAGLVLNDVLFEAAPSAAPTGLRGAVARERPAAVYPASEPCSDAGSMDGNVDDADNSNGWSAGDTAVLTSSGCVVRGVAIGGGLSLRLDAYSLTPEPYAESATVTLGFSNLSAGGNTLNGGATLDGGVDAAQGNVTLTFKDASLATPGHAARLNHSVRFAGQRALGVSTETIDGRINLDGQDYTLAQVVPFTLDANGLASGGTLEMREAQGARLRIVASTTNFIYQYFAPGNTGDTPDSVSTGAPIPR